MHACALEHLGAVAMTKCFHSMFRRFGRDQAGSISLVFGAAFATLALGGAVAVDYSNASSEHTKMRSALDAAVIAATRARADGNSNWRKLGEDVMAGNYPQTPVVKPVLTLDGEIVRGAASREVPMNMARLVGVPAMRVEVKSAATVRRPQANACILALAPTTGLNLSGYSEIESNCGIHANASSPAAYSLSLAAKIKTNANTGVGGASVSGSATITTPQKPNAEFFPDPLASTPEPTPAGACRYINLSGYNTVSLAPGRYCEFSVSGSADITLQPGIHTFETTISLSNMVTLRGNGVLLHIAAGGGVSISGASVIDIKAMTSGPYAGIGLFQSRSNYSGVSLSGLADFKFDGVLYAPAASLSVSGGSGGSAAITSDIAIVVNDLSFSGYSKLKIARNIGGCGPSSILPASIMAMCKGDAEASVRLVQ